MYNLIVTAAEGAWDNDSFVLDLSRYLEHTDDAVVRRLKALDERVCDELMTLATLFAYETPVNGDARVGWIRRIQVRGGKVRIAFQLDDEIAPIPPEKIESLKWELEIGAYEMSRTHWAVKEADLLSALNVANHPTPAASVPPYAKKNVAVRAEVPDPPRASSLDLERAQLGDEGRFALDFVTADYLTGPVFVPMSGQILRAKLSGSYAEKLGLIGSLSERQMLVPVGEPPDGDAYSPTQTGALASSIRVDVRMVLSALHETIKAKQQRDAAFRTFSFMELADHLQAFASSNNPADFVNRVMTLFGVAVAAERFDGSDAWKRPERTEELVELPSIDSFITVLNARDRAGTRQRAQVSNQTASTFDDFPAELEERFRCVDHIGDGGYASVYLIVDRESQRRWAVKIARRSPDAKQRSLREAEAMTKLQHDNILAAVESDPEGRWFILPLAEGTLGQLQNWGLLGPETAREVCVAVGNALAHAHVSGFLHRDLHTENVLRHDGKWKVADWGLTIGRDHRRLTRTKSVGGIAAWAAPEQLRSLKDADERSDLFSLGRIVEWLTSGKLPEPNQPGSLPQDHPLAGFVNASTRLNREERPRTVRDALKLLGSGVSEAPIDLAPVAKSARVPGLETNEPKVDAMHSPLEAQLTIDFTRKQITQEHHDYELVVTMKNVARRRFDDWEMELEFPTPLLDGVVHAIKVEERSNAKTTVFRVDGRNLEKSLRPGDEQPVRIGYFVNEDIYWNRKELFDSIVRARASVDGVIVAELERPIRDLQNF